MTDTKQILVVRKDLNMRKGKIAAQCAHASMKVLLDLMDTYEYDVGGEARTRRTLDMEDQSPIHSWLNNSFAKICVYVQSEEELERLQEEANEAGLFTALIVDSGRTEFHGVPTKTVLAIGPGWCDDVNVVTGHLPLL